MTIVLNMVMRIVDLRGSCGMHEAVITINGTQGVL